MEETIIRKIGECYEITTPYLDKENDCIQFYLLTMEINIFLFDDSQTINNLEMSGFNFSKENEEAIQLILDEYGIKRNQDELIYKTHLSNIKQAETLFAQAIMKIYDLRG